MRYLPCLLLIVGLSAICAPVRSEAFDIAIERCEAYSQAAIEQGYKGLNKTYGIARFLIHAREEGSLEAGLHQIFWTELSEQDSADDELFRLSEVVQGWQIYEYRELVDGEWMELTIALPDDGSTTIENQRLRRGFYVYQRNLGYVRSSGGPTLVIQAFRPVELNIE